MPIEPMLTMKSLIKYLILLALVGCNNSNKNVDKDNVEQTNIDQIVHQEEKVKKVGVIEINKNLSAKFDSLIIAFESFSKIHNNLDTLMIFQVQDKDTAIRKEEVKYLEEIGPHSASYLFKSDTIMGGNGFCLSEEYLFRNKKLVKLIISFSDCVESQSGVMQIICSDSLKKKWLYIMETVDIWDETEFEEGIEKKTFETILYYSNNEVKVALQKSFIDWREDLNLNDTVRYESLDIEHVSYLEPVLKIGKQIAE